MKKIILNKWLLSVSFLVVFSCKKESIPVVDKTPSIEVVPNYTPDSPMWRKLKSPTTYKLTSNGNTFLPLNMYTCVMSRADTTSDHLAVDNRTVINVMGNIDVRTIASGAYDPRSDNWYMNVKDGTPRYSPLMLGTFAVDNRGVILYFSLFGSGYSINESYPTGINFFNDQWLNSDYNLNGDIIKNIVLTGFMSNNNGFIIENDNNRQIWHIDSIQIYDKRKPFIGNFYGKFATTSAKINSKEYGFVISESQEVKTRTKEFYQYDAGKDTWVRKADFPGEDRYNGVIFGIDGKVYYGLGQSKTQAKGFRDIWQYDPIVNKWATFATYPGGGNIEVATALVSGKVYIGLGYYVGTTAINTEKYIGANDFWEFVPSRK